MGLNPFPCSCLLFFLFLGLASSAGISGNNDSSAWPPPSTPLCWIERGLFFLTCSGVFRSEGGAAGRALLQAKKSCTVDFENQNYSILVTQCKGPQYPASLCCAAFKQFACPFADQINDLTTDCASTMFSYINIYGKYPPGLFANECREGKEGLDCSDVPPAVLPQKNTVNASGSRDTAMTRSVELMVMSGFMALLILQLIV